MAQKTSSKKTKKAAAPARKAAPAKKPVKKVEAPKATKPAVKAVAAPAPAATKPAKKVSLSKSDLQHYRELLLEKRREILGDVGSMESEAFKGGSNLSNMPIHMADVGTDNFEQEFTLGLIESERKILREIQEALVRIDEGTFGVCLGTGEPIPRVRLDAVPWAKYTIEYSRLLESGKVNRDNGDSAEEESSSSDDDDE